MDKGKYLTKYVIEMTTKVYHGGMVITLFEVVYIITLVNVYVGLLVFTPVLYRPEVVDIGVNTIEKKHAICLKDYKIRSF